MGKPNTLGRGQYWELGNRIRMAFDHAGWEKLSYEKIGAKLGLSGGAVGKLVNGHIAGAYDTIRTIAILTNTNFDWIATGRGDMVYKIGGGMLSTEGLTEDQRRAVEAVINSYKSSTKA